MPDVLPVATFPIYPGLGQAPNMLDCIASGLVNWKRTIKQKPKSVGVVVVVVVVVVIVVVVVVVVV